MDCEAENTSRATVFGTVENTSPWRLITFVLRTGLALGKEITPIVGYVEPSQKLGATGWLATTSVREH